ncbi:short-chain dehydrogenase [Bifidobacterium rousetti]|uniref:SDR family NAD(P)-dependent oxidoreductase n=1 Tax=Bifidobacterium rousetti TaxID=2045439 RepID=UPI00123C5B9B|nr:SDR family oxidoreductase [Bifidobacterium rousetti]KAA8819440.1 short-chain dehydrogenase [Bifidobacterium rousetti]
MVRNYFDLTGRVALVTGGASGLGEQAAYAYADAGAALALLDVNADGLERVRKTLENAGHEAIALTADVTDESQVERAVHEAIAHYGRIDIVLNDAGINRKDDIEVDPLDTWNEVFEVNVTGIRNVLRFLLPHFKENRYGKIVNISSIAALHGNMTIDHACDSYHASKAAVLGLTINIAARYARYGITANAIAPSYFQTGMTSGTSGTGSGYYERPDVRKALIARIPAGRVSNVDELNGTVLFLSSDASSFVQGQYITVDGGGRLI